MKILITGGHVTPALALIEALKNIRTGKELSIIFVGRKYALDSEKTLSFEYKEVIKNSLSIDKQKIKFIPLQAGRLTRILSIKSLRSLMQIPLGFINALEIIKKEKPNIIFSFGGYIALPIAFWGWIFKIPIYTHEQTIEPGLANKIIGFFAKKIFLAFDEAKNCFNLKKTIVVGNPLRQAIYKISVRSDKKFILEKRPVIYITGGSLGSHSINLHIEKILPKLLKKYSIIHQIGDTKEYQDYERLAKFKNKYYFPVQHFSDDEIGYIYSQADLVISRAGANTFFELIALKKPAIFIPLPWSANNEQKKQALIFAEKGAGEIFYQNDDSGKLLLLIDKMINDSDNYKQNLEKLAYLYKKDAAEVIIKTIMAENKMGD